MPPQPSLEQIKSKVAVAAQRNPAYGEVAGWLGELLAITLAAPAPRIPHQDAPGPGQDGSWLASGRCLYRARELPVDLEQARLVLGQLAQATAQRPASQGQAAGLQRLCQAAPPEFGHLVAAFLAGDRPPQEKAAQTLGLEPPVLGLFLRLALRPSLLALAQDALGEMDLSAWSAGHCPVCGSAPSLASLAGEGGRRSLHCSLCETAWPTRRLECPFCQNQEAEDLLVLWAEGEEGYRLDLCRACGQYLKTLDLRSLAGPVVPILDELTTWHLDLVAEKYLEQNAARQKTC